MNLRRPHLAGLAALAFTLALPGLAIAAGPAADAPPARVTAWQGHLEHMRSMGGNLGEHVTHCVAMHGSMAGLLGPNGAMVTMMDGGMMR